MPKRRPKGAQGAAKGAQKGHEGHRDLVGLSNSKCCAQTAALFVLCESCEARRVGLLRFYKQTACHTLCMQGGIQHSVRHKREKASRKNNEMQARKTWKIMKNPCPTHSDPARIDPRRLRRLPKHPQASQNDAQRVPRLPQECPRAAQRRPEGHPRSPKELPKVAWRGPKAPQRHQNRSKISQNGIRIEQIQCYVGILAWLSFRKRFAYAFS